MQPPDQSQEAMTPEQSGLLGADTDAPPAQLTPIPQPDQLPQSGTPGEPGELVSPAQPRAPSGQPAPRSPMAAPSQPADQPMAVSGQPEHEHEHEQWVTLSSVVGRAIVDLSNGSRLGTVQDVVLSKDRRSVEGYVTKGSFLHRSDVFPAQGATIGADAITLPAGLLEGFDGQRLQGLPLASTLNGMRLLTDTGSIIGVVKDVRIDPKMATVLGYEVEPQNPNLLQRLRHEVGVLPPTAIQQHGADALIVSEDQARQHLGELE